MYREKFKILKSLYDLYDHHVNEIGTFVCEKGCAACCTCNVTMTSLETAYLFSSSGHKPQRKFYGSGKSKTLTQKISSHCYNQWFCGFVCVPGKNCRRRRTIPSGEYALCLRIIYARCMRQGPLDAEALSRKRIALRWIMPWYLILCSQSTVFSCSLLNTSMPLEYLAI